MRCNRERGEPVLQKACDELLAPPRAPDFPCSGMASVQS
jgi:hypothetical protein